MLRLFDVRAGEGRVALGGFALLLLLILTGHTVLEAARDALLLTGPGPRALGLVYMIIAVCAWPAAALAARIGSRFGPRRALGGTLVLAAVMPAALFVTPTTPASAMAVYVASGVIGSVVVPQFWTLVGTVLTVAQGRRLFGLIGAAGVLGGVLGSAAAAGALLFLPVKALLLVSAGAFVAAGAALARAAAAAGPGLPQPAVAAPVVESFRKLGAQPFLGRIALGVVLSTATLLMLDYCFKSTIARSLPPAEVGPFVARYYLALNGVSLVVQVFLTSAIVRRMGVAVAIVLTPALLLLGAAGVLVSGGAMLAVLLMKGIDGSLRYSVHRVTGELVYLPVPADVRQRVKPLIDGALGRASQTLTGAVLLAAGGTWLAAPRPLAVLVMVLALAWLLNATTMRRPYLALLRHAISTGSLRAQDSPDPLDRESAQLLVQHLAGEDPLEVVAAMSALSRRGRQGLVPALMLLHPDERVLRQALAILAPSQRSDWIPLGRRLLDDARESVRMAAARALARCGELDLDRLAHDVGWRVKGYAAIDLALRDEGVEVLEDARVASLLAQGGQPGDLARLGMLAAVADAEPDPRLGRLLVALGDLPFASTEASELLARASAKQADTRMIPRLVDRLAARDGREAVRSALVTFGDLALDQVAAALRDPARPRRFRIHAPKTLARFGTQRAADELLERIESDPDGLVRYKSIRALGQVVSEHRVTVDTPRVEQLVLDNLTRHFDLLALRAALSSPAEPSPAPERLLVGLLDDKLHQSLDRAFRLLEVAHPRQGLHRVRLACMSTDPYVRANAGELLDTLLGRRDPHGLRPLLRIITDELPVAERLRRAAPHLPQASPDQRGPALARLARDPDPMLARLASLCVGRSSGAPAPDATVSTEAHHV